MTRVLFFVFLLTFVKVNIAEEGEEPSVFSIISGIPDPQIPWPKKTVVYKVHRSNNSLELILHFNATKNIIKQKTCVRFKRRSNETDFLSVTTQCVSNSNCTNQVGKIGGPQAMQLGPNCYPDPFPEFKRRAYLHELLHVLGFHHEHNRYDRDLYVTINSENIRSEMLEHFNKRDSSEPWQSTIPYDYQSVMHFSRTEGSTNDGDAITPLEPYAHIGEYFELSELDIMKINKLYCPGTILIRIESVANRTEYLRVEDIPWIGNDNRSLTTWTVDWYAIKYPSRGSTLTSWNQDERQDEAMVLSVNPTSHRVTNQVFNGSDPHQKWWIKKVLHPYQARWQIINLATNRCLALEEEPPIVARYCDDRWPFQLWIINRILR